MKAALVISRPSILRAQAARMLVLAAVAAVALLASVLSANAAAAPYNFTWSSTFSTTVSGAHPNMRLSFTGSGSETLQTLRVDLPAGLMHDPSGASACTASALAADTCPSTSEIGSVATRIAVGPLTMQVPGTIYRVVDPASDADLDVALLLRPPLSSLGLLPKLVMRDRVAFTNGGGLRHTIGAVGSVPFAGGAIAVRMTAMNMQFLARQPVTGRPLLSNSTHCVISRLVATATTRAGSTGTRTSSITPTGCSTLPFSPTAEVSLGSDMVNETTSIDVKFGTGLGRTDRAAAHISRMRADLSELGTFDLDAFDAIPGCSDTQAASADGCPAESQVGELTVEIAGFGMRTGRVFHSTAPGHTVAIELSLRKNLVEWIKGSVDHRSSGGGAILTVNGLPQLPFTTFRVIASNQVHHNTFRTSSTCGPVRSTIELSKFDGTRIPIVRGSALHGCPPTVSLVDPADRDDDDDGFANQRFRPAFFDVFFDVADAGSGVESVECTAVATDGSRTRLRVVPTAQTTGRYVCNAVNLPEGDVTLEISAREHRGHVTVLKMSVTVDTTPPAASFVNTEDEDCVNSQDDFSNACFRPAFFDVFFTATDAGSGVDQSKTECAITDGNGNLRGKGVVKKKPSGDSGLVCEISEAVDGDAVVEIRAVDHRGHVTVLKMSVTVDGTPPAIAIDEPGAHITGDPDFDFFPALGLTIDGLSSESDLDPYRCDFGIEGDFDSISRPTGRCAPSPGGGIRLMPGMNSVIFKAMDAAGNVSLAFFDVFYDAYGPVVTLQDGADRDCDSTNGPPASACFRPAFFDVFFEVVDEGSGVSEISCSAVLPDGTRMPLKDTPRGQLSGQRACAVEGVPDGDAVVEIRAVDHRGHVTVLKMSVTVDGTPPAIAIDESGAHIIGDPDFDLLFTVRDDNYGSSSWSIVGEETEEDCDDEADPADPTLRRVRCMIHAVHAGPDRMMVTATDLAGNSSSSFFDVFYDLDDPSIAIDESGAHIIGDPDFDLHFTVQDDSFDIPGSTPDVACRLVPRSVNVVIITGLTALGQSLNSKFAGTCAITNAPDGEYELQIEATDAAGHVTVLPMSLTVDTMPPEVEFFAPGSQPFDGWPWLFFSVDDANPGHSVCRLFIADTGEAVGEDNDCDGYADTAGRPCDPDDPIGADLCRGVFVLPHVLESSGRYRAEVTHTDLAGHIDTASVNFELDTEAPEIAIDEPGVHFTGDAFFDIFTELGFTIDGRGPRDVGGYRCGMLMEGDFESISRPTSNCAPGGPSPIELSPGLNHLVLMAEDAAGNFGTAFFDVFYDAYGPVVTLQDEADQACDSTNGPPASACFRPAFFDVFFEVVDEGSGVSEISCSAVLPDGTRMPLKDTPRGQLSGQRACAVEGVPEGDAVIEIRAVDHRGHVTVLKMSVTVDGTPPAITIDEPGAHFTGDAFFDIFTELGFKIDGRSPRDVGGYRCAFSSYDGDFDGISRPTSNCAPGGPSPIELSPGLNHLVLVAEDAAGNMGTAFFDVFYDAYGPVVTLQDEADQDCDSTNGPPASACFRPAFFDVFFEVVDEGSGVSEISCSAVLPDGTRMPLKDKPQGMSTGKRICSVGGVPDGDAVVEIGAVDHRGHVTVLKMSVTVDATAPQLAIAHLPTAPIEGDGFFDVFTELGVTIDGNSQWTPADGVCTILHAADLNGDGVPEEAAQVACPGQGSGGGSGGSNGTLNLAEGENTIMIDVSDVAGNSIRKSITITFRKNTST